ncbi:dnaJ homolog subfamily C member 1-like [Condylostylus longicornis]|uniref:dnaJ homolog subfamily C member 1-like n=1 Tax=Condylostylus longicornis TaxID=2530218 RepID=UPI00244E1991|nr:dnaJ homolog subfamily C member 1-like [Condylostylus longicornis]
MKFFIIIYIYSQITAVVYSWDNDELEIFDLVEEINRNFYDMLGLEQDASAQQIKKAFRNLSVMLHPDKNKASDANIQFRNIVAIYEVLKDSSKREKYDKVLKEGLPNWKSALFYYRRVRKLGLAEGTLIVFIVFSIGQYLYAWASFLEKKYTAEQILESKLKKVPKKKKNEVIEIMFDDISSPNICNTLPFQIPLFIWNAPRKIKNAYKEYAEFRHQEIKQKKREEEEAKIIDMQKTQLYEEKLKLKELRKRKVIERPPEKSDADLEGYSQLKKRDLNLGDIVKPVNEKVQISGGFWTDDDIAQLVSLVKKYSSGVPRRWETISEIMGRSISEITFMSAKLKENSYKSSINSIDMATPNMGEIPIIPLEGKKTGNGNIFVPQKDWSQTQQKALEDAITLYKNYPQTEKWIRIAEYVPDKTKDECQSRYKFLVQLVKTTKSSKDNDGNKLKQNNGTQSDSAENSENSDHLQGNDCLDNTKTLIEKKYGGKKRNLRKQRKKIDAELYEDSDISC